MSLKLPSTPFMKAVTDILRQLDATTIPEGFRGIVDALLVGGVAVHVYTQYRVSGDLDAVFSHRLLIPKAPVVFYEYEGKKEAVRFDNNYTEVLALMHPDWRDDAIEADKVGRIQIKVISPLDLAVSKVGRLADNDRMDIAELASGGLIDADALEQRCNEALDYYVGAPNFIKYNIRDAVEIVRSCSPNRSNPATPPELPRP